MAEKEEKIASPQERAIHQFLQELYEPCESISAATELLSTEQIMQRLNASFPGIALTGDTTFELMRSLGFRQIENDTLEFLWPLKKRS